MPYSTPPPVFAILSALVEERVGLHYGPADQALLAEKAGTRALEAGFESLLDYYYYLRYDDPDGSEFDALIDALVVGETYFFREPEQLRVMVDTCVAPMVRAGGRARIWSAACATGEEPLTVAMLLADRGLLGAVEIVATDVSRRALERARRGDYGTRALRHVPWPALAARYIHTLNGRVHVDESLLAAIHFHRLNLLDDAAVAALGAFDVVLCRNVLIYFNDERVREIVDRLSRALRPGGALFVGVSESLLRFDTRLECLEREGVFFYRRPRA